MYRIARQTASSPSHKKTFTKTSILDSEPDVDNAGVTKIDFQYLHTSELQINIYKPSSLYTDKILFKVRPFNISKMGINNGMKISLDIDHCTVIHCDAGGASLDNQ